MSYLDSLPIPLELTSKKQQKTQQQLKQQYQKDQKSIEIEYSKILKKKDKSKEKIDNFDGDINSKEFLDLMLSCYTILDLSCKEGTFREDNSLDSFYSIYEDVMYHRYNFVKEEDGKILLERSNGWDPSLEIKPWKKCIFIRYPNIYPLNNPVHIDDIFDYNANIINHNGFDYIASQCPMDGFDICLFLKMLIDNDIRLINIPAPFESGKMFNWFPLEKDKVMKHISSAEVKGRQYDFDYDLICLESKIIHSKDGVPYSSNYETIITYKIQILDNKNERKHEIKILQYDNWPDQDVPSDNYLLFQYMYKIYRYINNFKLNKMLTHCSAGVGRTGTVFCCVELLRYINDNYFNFETKTIINEEFNLSNKTKILKDLYKYLIDFMYKLRFYRPYMIQKAIQFQTIVMFIYNVFSLCLSTEDLNLDYIEKTHPLEQGEDYNTIIQNKRKKTIEDKKTNTYLTMSISRNISNDDDVKEAQRKVKQTQTNPLFDVFKSQKKPSIFTEKTFPQKQIPITNPPTEKTFQQKQIPITNPPKKEIPPVVVPSVPFNDYRISYNRKLSPYFTLFRSDDKPKDVSGPLFNPKRKQDVSGPLFSPKRKQDVSGEIPSPLNNFYFSPGHQSIKLTPPSNSDGFYLPPSQQQSKHQINPLMQSSDQYDSFM